MKWLHPAFLTPLVLYISIGASANVFAGVTLPPNKPVKMKFPQYSVIGIGKLPLRAQKVEISRAGNDMVTLRILSQNGAWTSHKVPAVSIPGGKTIWTDPGGLHVHEAKENDYRNIMAFFCGPSGCKESGKKLPPPRGGNENRINPRHNHIDHPPEVHLHICNEDGFKCDEK